MTAKRMPVAAICLICAVALLGGCESARKVFSTEKSAPDEFSVYSRPPLSLPPEYKLRPPAPGEREANAVDATSIAERAMKGKGPAKPSLEPRTTANLSPGTQALLRDTGALRATGDIRILVDEETSNISQQDQAFVDKLIFWVDEQPYPGTVVDAEKEQKRIQENMALGKPITEGETPQIKRKRERKGLLDF